MSTLNEKDRDLIERYFLDKLNEEERAQFKEKQKEEVFASEVALHESLLEAIEIEGDHQMKNMLEAEEVKITETSPRPIPITKWLIGAAAIALLILAGWWIFNQKV